MLHMDIIKERLIREHKMETIFTIPNVVYLVKSKQKSIDEIKSGRNIIDLARTGMRKYVAHHEKRTNIAELELLEEHELTQQLEQLVQMRLVVRS
jgi:translation elongation factor EF-4